MFAFQLVAEALDVIRNQAQTRLQRRGLELPLTTKVKPVDAVFFERFPPDIPHQTRLEIIFNSMIRQQRWHTHTQCQFNCNEKTRFLFEVCAPRNHAHLRGPPHRRVRVFWRIFFASINSFLASAPRVRTTTWDQLPLCYQSERPTSTMLCHC
jgi:hypothetical protein